MPPGVSCPPQTLGGNQKSVLLAVVAADKAAPFTGVVKIKGTAVVAGQKVVREARSASVMTAMQAQQEHCDSDQDRSRCVPRRSRQGVGQGSGRRDRYAIALNDKTEVPIKLIRHDANFKANFQIAPVQGEMPTGVNFAALTFAPGKDEQKAVITVGGNATPGLYNLVFRGFASIAPETKDPKAAKAVNTILPATPVQLYILPKQVATLSLSSNNVVLKARAEEVIVKTARLFDYADSFKVQLIIPPDMKGVTAQDVVMPRSKRR